MINIQSSAKAKIFACFFLLLLALGIRLQFQQGAEAKHLLRNDALEYFTAAYNLRKWGILSTETPKLDTAPKPDAVRTPGYPFLLATIILSSTSLDQALIRSRIANVVLGSLTVALTSWIIWSQINPVLAILSGILLAINPHLIVMESYLLTETLFTFELVVGLFITHFAFQKNSPFLALVAGAIFGYTALTRPSALLIPVFICFFLLVAQWRQTSRSNKRILGLFLLSWLFFVGIFFIRNAVSIDSGAANVNRGWESFLQGTYPDLSYKPSGIRGYPYMYDPLYSRMAHDKFFAIAALSEKVAERPFDYFFWYLIGKNIEANKWDISSEGAGDIYVYPIEKSPFEYSSFFKTIRSISLPAHWVIVFFGVSSAFLLFIRTLAGKTESKAPPLVILCSLIVMYHALQNLVFFPIARYTIPLKPIYAILTSYALLQITVSARRYFKKSEK